MLYKWLLFKLSDRKKNDFKIKNPDLSSLEWKNQILFSACGKLFSYFIVMYETYDKSDLMCVNSDELGYKTMGKICILFSALLHQSQAHNDKTESMPSISALVTDSCKYLKFAERFWLSTLKPTLYLAMLKKNPP